VNFVRALIRLHDTLTEMFRALVACLISSLVVGFFFGVFTWIEEGFRTHSFFQGTIFAFIFAMAIALFVGLPLLRLAKKRNITGGFYYARTSVIVAAAVVIGVSVAVGKFDAFAAKTGLVLGVSGAVAGLAFNRIANAGCK
jgi:hypothetical protein